MLAHRPPAFLRTSLLLPLQGQSLRREAESRMKETCSLLLHVCVFALVVVPLSLGSISYRCVCVLVRGRARVCGGFTPRCDSLTFLPCVNVSPFRLAFFIHIFEKVKGARGRYAVKAAEHW